MVVLEGWSVGLQGGVGSERFTRRSHSSLESHILLLPIPARDHRVGLGFLRQARTSCAVSDELDISFRVII